MISRAPALYVNLGSTSASPHDPDSGQPPLRDDFNSIFMLTLWAGELQMMMCLRIITLGL
jgi:hypothetical protein